MERALALAAYAAEQDEVPIGAVIVNPATGEIISEAYNLCEHVADASAHAELLAIRKACENLKATGCGRWIYMSPSNPARCVPRLFRLRVSKTFISARRTARAAQLFPVSDSMTVRLATTGRKFMAACWKQNAASLLKDFFKKEKRKNCHDYKTACN